MRGRELRIAAPVCALVRNDRVEDRAECRFSDARLPAGDREGRPYGGRCALARGARPPGAPPPSRLSGVQRLAPTGRAVTARRAVTERGLPSFVQRPSSHVPRNGKPRTIAPLPIQVWCSLQRAFRIPRPAPSESIGGLRGELVPPGRAEWSEATAFPAGNARLAPVLSFKKRPRARS